MQALLTGLVTRTDLAAATALLYSTLFYSTLLYPYGCHLVGVLSCLYPPDLEDSFPSAGPTSTIQRQKYVLVLAGPVVASASSPLLCSTRLQLSLLALLATPSVRGLSQRSE